VYKCPKIVGFWTVSRACPQYTKFLLGKVRLLISWNIVAVFLGIWSMSHYYEHDDRLSLPPPMPMNLEDLPTTSPRPHHPHMIEDHYPGGALWTRIGQQICSSVEISIYV
jgi:hypothetical protein